MSLNHNNVDKRFISAGKVIFKEGDLGDCAYIVQTGSIGIFKTVKDEEVQLATLVAGEFFGEMAVIDGSPRMANARAIDDSVLVIIPKKSLQRKINAYEPFMRNLIQILVDNLRSVHEVYIPRPRSISDHFSLIERLTGTLQEGINQSVDPSSAGKADVLIKSMGISLKGAQKIMSVHEDRRASVLVKQKDESDKT